MAQKSWQVCSEVVDIMEEFIEAYPAVFQGFDVHDLIAIKTEGRDNRRKPVKIINFSYPRNVVVDKTYVVEVAGKTWDDMNIKKKRLSVFHTMLCVPDGGFDKQSENWGKLRKPELEMFLEEFAATGGVPNWMENPAAQDPIERAKTEKEAAASADGKKVKRTPMTVQGIQGSEEEKAPVASA